MVATVSPGIKCGISLRVVIGIVSAVTVLTVAAATFAITYTQSLATVEDTGLKYASALTTGARLQLSEYFDVPVKFGFSLQRIFSESGTMLPSDDPNGFAVVATMASFFELVVQYDCTAFRQAAMVFDEGSTAFINSYNGLMTTLISNCRTKNQSAGCCCLSKLTTRYLSNFSVAGPVVTSPINDQRFNLYVAARAQMLTTPAVWQAIFYSGDPITRVGFSAIPVVFSIFNATQFLGLMTFPVRLDYVTNLVKNMSTTPNSNIFVLDTATSIIATTHPANFTSTMPLTAASKVAPNCATSSNGLGSGSLNDPTVYVLCRSLASNFEYEPLRVAARNQRMMSPPPGTTVVGTITAGSQAYFVASGGVQNLIDTFQLTILLLMPDTDIVGDIYRTRTTVMVIVALILLVATGASFFVTALLLKPLEKVAKRMVRTSRLRDVSDDDGDEEQQVSSFDEIRKLQSAYSRVRTAVQSFTRYVPKEIVKDLMQTGQLCEIQMQTMTCTMLFVDIAGFTSMCERVPSQELSQLVRSYFEVMTRIVMNHEGLIDKFIGDSIMAVWGAPFAVQFQEVKATLAGLLIDHATRGSSLASEFAAAGEVLSVRVGIATGEVLAGNMGSEDRMSYTVIGDPVNVAARLESLNKQFGTRVMIAEATAIPISGFFVLRELMRIAVVGKTGSCRVYEVMGLREPHRRDPDAWEDMRSCEMCNVTEVRSQLSFLSSSPPAPPREVRRPTKMIEDALELGLAAQEADLVAAQSFTVAVENYHARDFAKALASLDELVTSRRREGSDKAASLLRLLCEKALMNPDHFDGVWRAEQK